MSPINCLTPLARLLPPSQSLPAQHRNPGQWLPCFCLWMLLFPNSEKELYVLLGELKVIVSNKHKVSILNLWDIYSIGKINLVLFLFLYLKLMLLYKAEPMKWKPNLSRGASAVILSWRHFCIPLRAIQECLTLLPPVLEIEAQASLLSARILPQSSEGIYGEERQKCHGACYPDSLLKNHKVPVLVGDQRTKVTRQTGRHPMSSFGLGVHMSAHRHTRHTLNCC